MFKIYFDQGTLLIKFDAEKDTSAFELVTDYLTFDERVRAYRARAFHYSPIVLTLHRAKLSFEDHAKDFVPLSIKRGDSMTPRWYQQEALNAWWSAGGRGVVVMPTGSGKSFLAFMAIMHVKRPTLIVVPTIDLMQQWARQLETFFERPVGMLGGGSKEILELTVSTYDSAVLRMEQIGNRFGLIVFDECHHLPGPVNRQAASMCLAPYRLAVTATPERNDDGEEILFELVGDIAYRIEIDQLEGKVLAPYTTEQIHLALTEDEQQAYDYHRSVYINFVRANRIDFSRPEGWGLFIAASCRLPGGKEAFRGFLEQKRIARTSSRKMEMIWELIVEHAGERMIIFTADNDTAYELGRRFIMPVITHHTKATERKLFLDRFRSGEYTVLVTSKVLNEGIDVPEASVGIVVSGSGSTREHVQRLGRILRPSQDKQAVLYELISGGTSEESISERRRNHRAYYNK